METLKTLFMVTALTVGVLMASCKPEVQREYIVEPCPKADTTSMATKLQRLKEITTLERCKGKTVELEEKDEK